MIDAQCKPTPGGNLAKLKQQAVERPNFGSNGQKAEQRPVQPAEPVITMTQRLQFAQTASNLPTSRTC